MQFRSTRGLLAMSAALVLVAACSGTSPTATTPQNTSGPASQNPVTTPVPTPATSVAASPDLSKYTVQVIYSGVYPYFTGAQAGVEAQAKALGINIQVTQSAFDETKEIANIQNAITKGVNGIIIVPNSSTGAIPAIQAADDAGICTVAQTVNLGDITYVSSVFPGMKGYVGLDELQNGRLLGESLAQKMGGSGGVVVIQGVKTNVGAYARELGASEVFQEKYPNIHILADQAANFDNQQASALMQDYLVTYGSKIKGVIAITNPMGIAAADVIAASPYAGTIPIVSVGGEKQYIDYMAQGKTYATVPEVPYDESVQALNLIVACILGDKTPVYVNTLDLPAYAFLKAQGNMITKDNASQFKAQW
jgi:ABC-type sugar transport system substrate-binding protein